MAIFALNGMMMKEYLYLNVYFNYEHITKFNSLGFSRKSASYRWLV